MKLLVKINLDLDEIFKSLNNWAKVARVFKFFTGLGGGRSEDRQILTNII